MGEPVEVLEAELGDRGIGKPFWSPGFYRVSEELNRRLYCEQLEREREEREEREREEREREEREREERRYRYALNGLRDFLRVFGEVYFWHMGMRRERLIDLRNFRRERGRIRRERVIEKEMKREREREQVVFREKLRVLNKEFFERWNL